MRRIILLFAMMISAAFVAVAQNSNMEIVFNFDKCEYFVSSTGHHEVESVFYQNQPQGFDKFWEKRKAELCGVFQNAANQSANGKYLFGGYINSPYYVVVNVQQLDPDGELECVVKVLRRAAEGEYEPTIAEYEIGANGGKSQLYDNISSEGFRKAGFKFGKQMLKYRPVR